MHKRSAGVLPYRNSSGRLEVLLVHPGGPFWEKKDLGAWSIAKGEYGESEDVFHAALREFQEETGYTPTGPFLQLSQRKQPSGKVIDVWATETDWDPAKLVSNMFSMEWPKGSGRIHDFPEVDRAEWFDFSEALHRILPGQQGFLEELFEMLTGGKIPELSSPSSA